MSEQRDDAPGFDESEVEHEEADEVVEQDGEGEEQEDDGDDEEKPAPKPVDWEKRAHSHAGQAARERSRRQAAERRATEYEARIERLEKATGSAGGDDDELLALIGTLRDDEEDPVGDIASVKRALKLLREREVRQSEQNRHSTRLEREIEGIKTSMADSEADFAIDHPDYKDAAAFYRKARTEELRDSGYSGDDLMAKLANDLFGMVQTASANGRDPAEAVYNLAKKRGFKAGGKMADKKLDAIDRSAATGVRPQSRPAAGVLTWGDVAKLDGAAREKAWDALRKREIAKK